MQKEKTQDDEWEMFKANFSESRLAIYLRKTGNSEPKAKQLYVWNARISAALWELIGYLEISLRTTIDKQLATVAQYGDWLGDPKILSTNDSLQPLIIRARKQATVYGREPDLHQVLDQLPLGFLQALLSKRFLHLWPTLAGGFKGANRNSHNELSTLVRDFRKLRNRIGHHNHLLDLDVSEEYSKLLRLAELVDPNFMQWIESNSNAKVWLGQRPA